MASEEKTAHTGAPERRISEAAAPLPNASPAPAVSSRQWIFGVTAVLFVAWLLVLNFRPVVANDFWIHLRTGEDILHTGQIPRVDDYSAAGRGRPFVAHEWLGAVLIAVLVRAFGAFGPTLLSEAVALGVAALLFVALSRESRRSVLLVPLLVLCMYLTCFRIGPRPECLTFLLLAAFLAAVERWRRTRRLRDIVWLAPVEVLWANFHGAFLMGVVVIWAAVVYAACCARFPRFQGEERTYSWRQVGEVFVVAIGCSLAPLVNPYGVELLTHTIKMSQGSEFAAMRTRITEWQPPFSATSYFRANFPYLMLGFALQLVLLWTTLLLRLRHRPFLDLCVAAMMSWLALTANRFIPFVAIAGFPIVVRNGDALTAQAMGDSGRRWRDSPTRSLFECTALAAIIAATIAYGYPYGPQRRAELGWGYAGRRPVAEVAYIREHHLRGTVYTEALTEGSYVMYALYPLVRPVVDARIDMLGEQRYLEYEKTHDSGAALLAYLDRYDVRLAIVFRGGRLGSFLVNTGKWTRASQSAERMLLTRR